MLLGVVSQRAWLWLYARFPEILQNYSERQIVWIMCSVVFHALTLKLTIQTSLSMAPKLPISFSSTENYHKFNWHFSEMFQ